MGVREELEALFPNGVPAELLARAISEGPNLRVKDLIESLQTYVERQQQHAALIQAIAVDLAGFLQTKTAANEITITGNTMAASNGVWLGLAQTALTAVSTRVPVSLPAIE